MRVFVDENPPIRNEMIACLRFTEVECPLNPC